MADHASRFSFEGKAASLSSINRPYLHGHAITRVLRSVRLQDGRYVPSGEIGHRRANVRLAARVDHASYRGARAGRGGRYDETIQSWKNLPRKAAVVLYMRMHHAQGVNDSH